MNGAKLGLAYYSVSVGRSPQVPFPDLPISPVSVCAGHSVRARADPPVGAARWRSIKRQQKLTPYDDEGGQIDEGMPGCGPRSSVPGVRTCSTALPAAVWTAGGHEAATAGREGDIAGHGRRQVLDPGVHLRGQHVVEPRPASISVVRASRRSAVSSGEVTSALRIGHQCAAYRPRALRRRVRTPERARSFQALASETLRPLSYDGRVVAASAAAIRIGR